MAQQPFLTDSIPHLFVTCIARLPAITIAPVTEWMEQERVRAEHEQQKQRYLERKEREQQAAALAAQQAQVVQPAPPRANVPRNQLIMKAQGDSKVVNRYKVIKRDQQDK